MEHACGPLPGWSRTLREILSMTGRKGPFFGIRSKIKKMAKRTGCVRGERRGKDIPRRMGRILVSRRGNAPGESLPQRYAAMLFGGSIGTKRKRSWYWP